jgi:hypothetical protein
MGTQLNKTNYKRFTIGKNVNKSRITILIILIINLNISPVISFTEVDMDMQDSFTSLQNTQISIDNTSKLNLTWLHDQGYNNKNGMKRNV